VTASFSRRAKADIRDIWDYTVDVWGIDPAGIYLAVLEAAVDSIVENPKLGRPYDDIRPGYRKHLVGSHVLYYRLKRKKVFVVRILHQRMVPERHF
jgi:toxin ParE1/3/4